MAVRTAEERVQRPSADATRERILAAALDLFSERSFEGASTRLIAERAGVQQPLLTYHFGTKEELWRAAVGQLFEDLARSLGERVAGLRGVEDEMVAKLVVADFVRFSATHPQLHRIIMQECKSEGDRLAWLVARHIRPLYEGAVALLEPLVASGKVRDVPARTPLLPVDGGGGDHLRAGARVPAPDRRRPARSVRGRTPCRRGDLDALRAMSGCGRFLPTTPTCTATMRSPIPTSTTAPPSSGSRLTMSMPSHGMRTSGPF